MKRLIKAIAAGLSLILGIGIFFSFAVTLDGQVSTSTEEIYPGVTATDYYLEEGGYYSENGPQYLRVIEFDPKQEGLALDMVMGGENVGEMNTLSDIIDDFNETNTENKTVILGVNGDLWTQASHHSRVEGESDDPVVKQELCIPRGYNVSDGEIITTAYMGTETPYDDIFYSFGITDDGTPYIGHIDTRISLLNYSTGVTVNADGVNRLPANDSLVMYTDKGPVSNYALDDAYEVVIDFSSNYTLKHGNRIIGSVTAVSGPGEERYSMQENRVILTARGTDIKYIEDYAVGDRIMVTIRINDLMGNSEIWQESIVEACGGHVPVVYNGEACTKSYSRADPMTLIGYKADGTVIMIINDGRQEGYSIGINRLLYEDLCLELGLDAAFLLDGGGSTTLIELTEEGYELKNRPSDYNPDGVTQGCQRPLANAILLSYVTKSGSEFEKGDIDGSETITMMDLFKLKLHVKGTLLSEDESKRADIDGNGRIDMLDSFELKYRIVTGKWRTE